MKNQKKLLLFTVLLLSFSSFGAVLKVPQQFRTIYKALLSAQPEDTVFVSKGIYYENIVMVDEVVIRGEDKKTTIINGRQKGLAVVIGADKGVLENFTIRNGRIGILCKSTSPIIKNNIIIDNKGSGIMTIMSLPSIVNNVIMRNKWSGVFCQSSKAIDTRLENNVIIENGYNGVTCARITQILIRNNIIAGNDEYGIYCGRGSKRTRIVYNNFFGNFLSGTSYFAIENKTNVHKLPMFKKPYATISFFDYYCKPVSPMLKAGENGLDIGLLSVQQREIVSLDKDNDGINDDVDQCPEIPEDLDNFEDNDGCPDYDNDKDGIYDNRDKCPMEAEDKDGFDDLDGCPDTDNDGDGILDAADGCPNDAESFNGYKDEDGCPDEKPVEIKSSLTLEGINFRPGSADLLDESYMILDKVFNSLEAFPRVNLNVLGYTDNIGRARANMILSRERARTVMNYLINRGIGPRRLNAIGKGEDDPIASNRSAKGRAKNRRIEFRRVK